MSNVRPLPSHRPTGQLPWPIVLIEGPEKAGKTYESLKFSGDERIGETYALDLGEDSLEEYGQIDGARYLVVEHDGTWRQIIDRLEIMVEHGHAERAAGRIPLAVIDSGTAEWDMLKAWVDTRARRTTANKQKLARDPDAEVKAPRNFWNDADSRHNRFMNLLRSFPGPVIITARGKWVSATGKDGQPIPGEKDYRVEGQKNLGFAVNAWVRLSREAGPQIVGLRHPKWGIRPGIDAPKAVDDFSLGWLIFDVLGCATDSTRERSTVELDADQVLPSEVVSDDDAPQGGPDGPGNGGGQRQQPQRQQPPRPMTEAEVVDFTGRLLTLADHEKAKHLVSWFENPDRPQATRDAVAALTDDDRETLGIQPDAPITLYGLSVTVAEYVGKHNRSVRMPLDVDHPADQNRAA